MWHFSSLCTFARMNPHNMPDFRVVGEYLHVSACACSRSCVEAGSRNSSARSNQKPWYSGEHSANVWAGSHQHTANPWKHLELNWGGSQLSPWCSVPWSAPSWRTWSEFLSRKKKKKKQITKTNKQNQTQSKTKLSTLRDCNEPAILKTRKHFYVL